MLLFIIIIWSQILTRSGRSRARVHTGVFGAQRYCYTVLRPHLSPSPDKSRRMVCGVLPSLVAFLAVVAIRCIRRRAIRITI